MSTTRAPAWHEQSKHSRARVGRGVGRNNRIWRSKQDVRQSLGSLGVGSLCALGIYLASATPRDQKRRLASTLGNSHPPILLFLLFSLQSIDLFTAHTHTHRWLFSTPSLPPPCRVILREKSVSWMTSSGVQGWDPRLYFIFVNFLKAERPELVDILIIISCHDNRRRKTGGLKTLKYSNHFESYVDWSSCKQLVIFKKHKIIFWKSADQKLTNCMNFTINNQIIAL